jgi:hypothetical protein
MSMAWVVLLVKALFFATSMTLLVLALGLIPVPGDNSKAFGMVGFLRMRGELLLVAGFFQVVIGLLLLRVNVFVDGGKLHVTLLQ